ncbi:hypothetical protein MES4922_40133 [Mesorhizobium ventifaucium]|uniref:Uncharacterized protein n=1 Tax=Mesorhizobium ventifaucium TaxID=666020 RepID=A0ABM9E805_9HYPH|nr:hypothetical protein MES4922_40133 [Mesorhizobium ventifaucium]
MAPREKADRIVGGGILTKTEPSKASPRSDFMVEYPYVWNLAEMHRLGSIISLRSWNAPDRWSGWLTK